MQKMSLHLFERETNWDKDILLEYKPSPLFTSTLQSTQYSKFLHYALPIAL
jgi:hypothetical protein